MDQLSTCFFPNMSRNMNSTSHTTSTQKAESPSDSHSSFTSSNIPSSCISYTLTNSMDFNSTEINQTSPGTPVFNYPRYSNTPINFNANPYLDTTQTPLSLMTTLNDAASINSTGNTPYTPNSPYYNLSALESDLTNLSNNLPNNFVSHTRTISLPTTLNFKNLSNNTRSFLNLNDQHSSFNINRFSLPAIVDDAGGNYTPVNYSIENHLNNLSLDQSIPPPSSCTRRDTLFSNSSTSSNATSNSIISSHTRDTSMDFSYANSIVTSTPITTSSINSAFSTNDLSTLTCAEIMDLSRDQHGCRMLQKMIEDDPKKNLQVIFSAAYKHSTNLMLDSFGNYLIQKIIIHASRSQVSLILIEITPYVEQIATNLHGTRALQKLISCLNTSNHHDLIAIAVSPVIVSLIHDLNGNHVVQKLISHYNNSDLDFLIDLIILNLIPIASHKHGCCVLQKLMNKCSSLQIQKISNEILKNSVYLMKDQFGNYVIQYLISLNIDSINYDLLQIAASELISLSCGKFSSNVVEKCLKLNPANISNTIHPLLASLINFTTLMVLIKDQYGNYVVQTALDIADLPVKLVMAELIKPVLPNIKYSNYGKRIHNKIASIIADADISTQQNFQQKLKQQQEEYSKQVNLLAGISFCNN